MFKIKNSYRTIWKQGKPLDIRELFSKHSKLILINEFKMLNFENILSGKFNSISTNDVLKIGTLRYEKKENGDEYIFLVPQETSRNDVEFPYWNLDDFVESIQQEKMTAFKLIHRFQNIKKITQYLSPSAKEALEAFAKNFEVTLENEYLSAIPSFSSSYFDAFIVIETTGSMCNSN